jgi:ABC-type metal ion transport system substrate-binding protein
LTIIYKIIYPLGFFRKKQKNIPDFDNGITCAFLCLKIPESRKPLILLHKNTPMNLSTGGSEAGQSLLRRATRIRTLK